MTFRGRRVILHEKGSKSAKKVMKNRVAVPISTKSGQKVMKIGPKVMKSGPKVMKSDKTG